MSKPHKRTRKHIRKHPGMKRKFKTSSEYLREHVRDALDSRARLLFSQPFSKCGDLGKTITAALFSLQTGIRVEYTPSANSSTDPKPESEPKP